MKTLKLAGLAFALFTMLFSTVALAKPAVRMDGRGARHAVVKWHQQRNLSTNLRVHGMGLSRSGKSIRVAAENKNSGTVKLFNVRRNNNKAYRTPTSLTKQSTGAQLANRLMRREQGPNAGTFSGVNRSGLTGNGNQMVFNSATDRNEQVRVNLRNGQAYHTDL